MTVLASQRTRGVLGSHRREQKVAEETSAVRERAREALLTVMPPEGYTSVDAAYADAVTAVQGARSEAWLWEDVDRLAQELARDFGGYGPLQDWLDNPGIVEIMVRGTAMRVERADGWMEEIEPSGFRDPEHVRLIVERILLRASRRLDESSPIADAQIVMPDGALVRVNAVIPPVAVDGPYITIRKFRRGMTPEKYLETGAITPEAMGFLAGCVRGRLNVIVSGGTGSGKTTLLNVLGHFIPARARIVTIEDSLELALPVRDTLRHLTRPASVEGTGEITIRQLVRNALRQRPDRILIGETRGGEAFELLQAMNTGHEGSMSTLHANSAEEALSRLETMAMMVSDVKLPLEAIRRQVAVAVDVIVQVSRMRDGKRRVREIASLDGLDAGGAYLLTPLFRLEDGALRPCPGAQESRATRKLAEREEKEALAWLVG